MKPSNEQAQLGYYTKEELDSFHFKSIGKNVLISKKASIYTPEKISIGHDVRIDDFCFLVGNVSLGNYIHLAPFSSIHGTGDGTVIMKDFSAISSYAAVYAASDDYFGNAMTNPMVDKKYLLIHRSDIMFEKHSLVGLHSVILPGAYLAEGSAVGAMSLLSRKTKPWGVYFGIPAKRICDRKQVPLEMEKAFMNERENGEG